MSPEATKTASPATLNVLHLGLENLKAPELSKSEISGLAGRRVLTLEDSWTAYVKRAMGCKRDE